MKRPRNYRAVAVPAAGLLAITLAVVGTTQTGSASADDEPKSTDGDGSVSHTVSQQEIGEAADYWTPERMRDARPA